MKNYHRRMSVNAQWWPEYTHAHLALIWCYQYFSFCFTNFCTGPFFLQILNANLIYLIFRLCLLYSTTTDHHLIWGLPSHSVITYTMQTQPESAKETSIRTPRLVHVALQMQLQVHFTVFKSATRNCKIVYDCVTIFSIITWIINIS